MLWIIFYDDAMLGEPRRRGVGSSVGPETGVAWGGSDGQLAFADDTSAVERTVEMLQTATDTLAEVLGAAGLRVATERRSRCT